MIKRQNSSVDGQKNGETVSEAGDTPGGPMKAGVLEIGFQAWVESCYGEGLPWCTKRSQGTGKFGATEKGMRRENPAMPTDEMANPAERHIF